MENNFLNMFWRTVGDDHFKSRDYQVKASTLKEAIRIVASSIDTKHAFRCNKELIDIFGRFRIFSWNGRSYIIKKLDYFNAEKERNNAIEVKRRINSGNSVLKHLFHIPIPIILRIDKNIGVLVLPYYGFSLYENPNETRMLLSMQQMIDYFKLFLKQGIEWAGFLPRNIIRKNNKYVLIDWEDVIFSTNKDDCSISDLTLLKLQLGWSPIYGDINELCGAIVGSLYVRKEYTIRLDRFESVYDSITGNKKSPDEIRKKCSDMTLVSEGCIINNKDVLFTSMDIGHVLDDLLPSYLSVFYTFGTAKLRQDIGDIAYQNFIDAMVNVLCLGMRENGALRFIEFDLKPIRKLVVLALLLSFRNKRVDFFESLNICKNTIDIYSIFERNDCLCAAFIGFEKLKGVVGWEAAVKRACYLDIIMSELFVLVKEVFEISDDLDLLLRGSFGQGLVTSISDVDFEISGPDYIYGHTGLESLVGSFLETFDINWEGSGGRPKEADIISEDGLTRDIHELTEMRKPESHRHEVGWLKNKFDLFTDKWYLKQSNYEKSGNIVTAKFLFFEIRALIARIAYRANIQYSCTDCQLHLLEGHLPSRIFSELKDIAYAVLSAYEKGNTIKELINLSNRIDNIRIKLELPGPKKLFNKGE